MGSYEGFLPNVCLLMVSQFKIYPSDNKPFHMESIWQLNESTIEAGGRLKNFTSFYEGAG